MRLFFQRIRKTIARHRGLAWSLGALTIYTVTTLLIAYPAVLHLGTRIIGDRGGDAYQYAWSLWWAKEAVLSPDKGLAHLTLLNHPVGLEHPFMLTLVSTNLLALPFSLLFSPAVTYNTQVLLTFILSGLTMFWLCSAMTEDRRAGLVGGFIYAFFLNKTGHVLAGHLPQVTVYLFPLYVLCLRRLVARPGWWIALATALVLAPASLIHVIHLPYLVLPLTLIVLGIGVGGMGRAFFTRRRIGYLGMAFGLAAVMVAPFLLPTVVGALRDGDYLYKTGIVASSTDLLAFLAPSPYHPLFDLLGWTPRYTERVFPTLASLREGLAFPGIVAMGLAAWGLARRRREAGPWAGLALVAAVLSLGPLLKMGGDLVRYTVDETGSYIVLPYAVLKELPLLNVGRTPGRLNEATMFAVAILAAYGVAALAGRTERPGLRPALLALVLVFIGCESIAVWPLPTSDATIPPAIQALADDGGDDALLHLGMDRRPVHHRALYYQTYHERPCVGGRVHRTLPETPPWWDSISGLVKPTAAAGDVVPRPDPAERVAWLRHFDVGYVVLHENSAEGRDLRYRETLVELLGPPAHADDRVEVFAVPRDVPPPERATLYTFPDEGWHSPETEGEGWRRWMTDEGQLYVYSARETRGSLRFTVDARRPSSRLEVYRDQEPVDAFVVWGPATFTTRPFRLTRGMHVFDFRASRACDEASTPCRRFAYEEIAFVSEAALPPGAGLDVNFGDQIHLRGWEVDETELVPGETLTVTLAWEAKVPLHDRYVVFVHLVSPVGELVAQHDAPPVGEVVAAEDWPVGAVVRYPVSLEIPDSLPAGAYRLRTGVYLWPDIEPLPVEGAGFVELAEVEVGP